MLNMAGNGKSGDSRRHGYVGNRTQFENPKMGVWTKRNTEDGQFMDVKQDGSKFKGVRKEKNNGGSKK